MASYKPPSPQSSLEATEADDTEMETDQELEGSGTADESYASARSSSPPSTVAMSASASSGGIQRNRPSENIVLPPAPTFIPSNATSPLIQASQPSPGALAPSPGAFKAAVRRDSWTSFNAANFTPFESPMPETSSSASQPSKTPRARFQEVSESSYFTHRPVQASRAATTTKGSMTGQTPPPSPSIISRSRAPSSASLRTVRLATPGSGTSIPPPTPNREVPQIPVASLAALGISRQTSGLNHRPQSLSKRPNPDRSKSPAGARSPAAASRPSTSGALTPQASSSLQADSSRSPSAEIPSYDRALQQQQSFVKPGPPQRQKTLMAPSAASRPGLYQHKSKSLIDLSSAAERRVMMDSASVRPQPAATQSGMGEGSGDAESATTRDKEESLFYSLLTPNANGSSRGIRETSLPVMAVATPAITGLNRRRSMFEIRAEPPPYSIIHRRPEGPQMIFPRDEEGREKLPSYYCGVHIEGYLPRKMEFSAPGLQAKDRSWKRQYFVLHGTSLRVYKNDLSGEKLAANGSWGQLKGDHVHLEPMNEDGSSGGSGSTLGLGQAAREALSSHTPFGGSSSNLSASTNSGIDAKFGLVRNYTLQGAESGLAADYLKRRHVVRVRAEGEQFLLQTRSDRHVVDWIEALQAATNIAMDLEKRAMPKFITLPRRRRRRRRNADGTTMTPAEQEARDIAEAQCRSVAEATGRSSISIPPISETRRSSVSGAGRQSISIESELNPSAAFEEMLREDHEEISRQRAADI